MCRTLKFDLYSSVPLYTEMEWFLKITWDIEMSKIHDICSKTQNILDAKEFSQWIEKLAKKKKKCAKRKLGYVKIFVEPARNSESVSGTGRRSRDEEAGRLRTRRRQRCRCASCSPERPAPWTTWKKLKNYYNVQHGCPEGYT